MVVRSVSTLRRGALSVEDGETIRVAAASALDLQDPPGHGAGLQRRRRVRGGGLAARVGQAARAVTACSGIVPVVMVVTGPALSGPALLLGLADLVVMTADAFAFVSGPAMVEEFTGVRIGIHQLGGTAMHARSSGLCAIESATEEDAMAHVEHLLGLLPANTDELPPLGPADASTLPTTEPGVLREIIPDPGHQLLRRAPGGGRAGRRSGRDRAVDQVVAAAGHRPGPHRRPDRWASWPTSPRPWPAPWTSPPRRRVPASCGSVTPSTCRWSPWWTRRASCPARTSSGGA